MPMVETENHAELKTYRELQKYLNTMPVGFPKVKSGADIRILKRLFSPDDAKVTMYLDHKMRTVDEIWEKLDDGDKEIVKDKASLERFLYEIAKRGGIYTIVRNGTRKFCLHPWVLGMYEIASARSMSQENEEDMKDFLDDCSAFTGTKYGIEMLTIAKRGFRTIPIEESITPEHKIQTYDKLVDLINTSEKFGVLKCICKLGKKIQDEPCQVTDRLETCMAFNDYAKEYLKLGYMREVTKDEMLEIARQSEKEGLVLQPENTKNPNFICACCSDCCGLLHLLQSMPRPADFASSNFHALVDSDECIGCGICETRCNMNAVVVNDGKATVKLERCIGCGICVPTCKNGAIQLEENKLTIEPHEDLEEYMEHLHANKPSKFQKFWTLLKAFLRIPQNKK